MHPINVRRVLTNNGQTFSCQQGQSHLWLQLSLPPSCLTCTSEEVEVDCWNKEQEQPWRSGGQAQPARSSCIQTTLCPCWKKQSLLDLWQPEAHSWLIVKGSAWCLCCSWAGSSEKFRGSPVCVRGRVSVLNRSPAVYYGNMCRSVWKYTEIY